MIQTEAFIGLALRLARRRWWMYRRMDREDYEGEALLALVVAAGKYDDALGHRFSTYAYPRINGALINAERAWMHYNRREKDSPRFVAPVLTESSPFLGMTEADIEPISQMYEGEWFARPARMYLIAGLSAAETARLCNCQVNTVHQSVSYWRRRIVAELRCPS